MGERVVRQLRRLQTTTVERRIRAMLVAIALIGGIATFTGWKGYQLSHAIQQERARNIENNCEDANERHDSTIQALDSQIARLPESQRARAMAGRSFTIALIESLSPKRDCAELVARQVG